jgi:hypothetical protein
MSDHTVSAESPMLVSTHKGAEALSDVMQSVQAIRIAHAMIS